jgi:hypothetical protein
MSNQRAAINNLGSQFALGCAASTALTPVAGTTPAHATINVNSQGVRYTTDGTAPTATKGIHVGAGGQIAFMDSGFDYRGLIQQLRIIQEAATATLDVLFYD